MREFRSRFLGGRLQPSPGGRGNNRKALARGQGNRVLISAVRRAVIARLGKAGFSFLRSIPVISCHSRDSGAGLPSPSTLDARERPQGSARGECQQNRFQFLRQAQDRLEGAIALASGGLGVDKGRRRAIIMGYWFMSGKTPHQLASTPTPLYSLAILLGLLAP